MTEKNNPEKQERVGVYVCHCGTNISSVVDVEEVARWAGEQPNVEVSRDYKFMCSSLGQELIEQDIKEKGLTRVVCASCSPHMHEKTFRTACERGGLNPFLFEMTNIREHDSWITDDKEAATVKAKSLVRGSIDRVVHHVPLEEIPVEINPNTLVVGGGIAGITSALELAEAGYHVYLVEREPSIGGHMAQLDKTFPTLDCSACILTPKMVDVDQHDNITLLTWSEVEKVDGYLGNFTVTVRKKARFVNEEHCTGCGICIEKCPFKEVDDVFEAGMGERKVIYRPFPQAVPKYPVIDKENCVYFKTGKCKACEKFCPTEPNSIEFDQVDEILSIDVGNIILATGYDLFDSKKIPQYGYGKLDNVFTSLEFERMVNAAGPTDGKIVLRDKESKPKSVAIVHCVGSRDENYNKYCSKVCCMYSLKFAHLVHERIPDAEIYDCYIDMRTPGKGYEEFYNRLLEEGTHFIRGKVAEITDAARIPAEEGKLIVQVEDTLIGRQRRLPVDMVILSPAMEARAGSKEVSQLFKMGCDFDGFFVERHPKLDPVATMTDGIFIAGACQGPKDVPESVVQGAAAAARVAGLISRGTVMMEPVRASINQDACSGCRICNNMCPYNAIVFHEDEKVSEVITALCQGCGTCVAACPSSVISGAHFTNDQLLSQIEGILWDVSPEKAPA
ncbi:MAG: CoB--CoM heterodisulfide reductase iron-sulfur subunit A family protein [Anaerolineae bacterium]|jgi:heterodisulfide reductase subunit A|nr:CoB--CoM heterodisulfide reductase iron-sulfur subunit A family protein [Anaerolineae bacterium]MBT7991159.1 CoB--CoM heterodisulfide reductase iron-sulfur subunit A family protein [Anaerolineae bacterium]